MLPVLSASTPDALHPGAPRFPDRDCEVSIAKFPAFDVRCFALKRLAPSLSRSDAKIARRLIFGHPGKLLRFVGNRG